MPARYFTVAEANALLPTLRPLLEEMKQARQRIVEAQPDLWPLLEKALGNGGGKKAGALLVEFEKIQKGVREVERLGVQVKDVATGLVDFLSRRGNREVYLCWRLDETEVAHWHDLESGFAGRQPL